MKRYVEITAVILFSLFLILTGCTTRDSAQPSGEPTPGPQFVPEDSVTPTPEPTPAPLDYIEVPARDPAEYGYCENDSDVFDALERIRANPLSAVSPLSGTNTSEGIRQWDKVSTNGDLIFLIADKDLVIVRAAGEGSEVLSRTNVGIDWKGETDAVTGAYQGSEKVPAAVFCSGDRVIILSDSYGYKTENGLMSYSEYVSVDFYDITDPTEPKAMSSLGQSGCLKGAFTENGSLILVTEYQIYDDAVREDPADYIPAYFSEDTPQLISGDRICADYDGTFAGGAVMGLYDPAEGRLTDIHALMGVSADACYAQGAIIFFSPRRAEAFSRDVDLQQKKLREYAYADVTDLFVFRTADDSIALDKTGAVSGTVSDAACLDVYNGTIRCLTSLFQGRYTDPEDAGFPAETEEGSALSFLNGSLEPESMLLTLPDGSRIGWAGFAGEDILLTNESRTASCTYSGSECGEVVSAGTVGSHIRAWGESGYVFYDHNDAGQMTITLCSRSMQPIATRSFGSDHSSTLENYRAYISDEGVNLLTFTADDSFCIYGYSAEKGIELRADVYLNDWAWNAEGIMIGDLLYIVDTREVKAVSAETFEEICQLSF